MSVFSLLLDCDSYPDPLSRVCFGAKLVDWIGNSIGQTRDNWYNTPYTPEAKEWLISAFQSYNIVLEAMGRPREECDIENDHVEL